MKTSRRARSHVQTSGLVLHTNLTLIEVADPLLLEELRADRRLAPYAAATSTAALLCDPSAPLECRGAEKVCPHVGRQGSLQAQ